MRALVCAGLFGLAAAAPSAARSTLTLRAEAPVAGPGLEQAAGFILDLFPGDGQAILGVTLSLPPGLQIVDAVAARGTARVLERAIEVSYEQQPQGARATDTLRAVVVADRRGGLEVTARLRANVDAAVPHEARATLIVEAPLQARLEAQPQRLYPGEAVELGLELFNDDPRAIEAIDVDWPSVLTVESGASRRRTEPGAQTRSSWPLRVHSGARDQVTLAVRAQGGGLLASPLEALQLPVAPVPAFGVAVADGGPAQLLEPARLRLTWTAGAEPIPYRSLSAAVSAGFGGARLAAPVAGARLQSDGETGAVEVVVRGPGELAAHQSLAVELEVTPSGTGPFAWTGRFQPPDREAPLDVGTGLVRVVTSAGQTAGGGETTTDLDLITAGLRPALAAALDGMPLASAATVRLLADNKDDANWVVEGMLTQQLLGRGARVLATDDARHVLRYRVADARVVYSPAGKRNPFDASQRRDARAAVYLQLEDDSRRVLWARQVDSRAEDPATTHPAAWLNAGKGFAQATVEADHRALEMGLSGVIVGGLFFVFFAP